MRNETLQRIPTPTGILVGLPEDLSETCANALSDGGLRVLKVGHVAAAAERIPVTMPQLVVVSSRMRPEEFDHLNERCVAVGAEVLKIDEGTSKPALAALLRSAARNAFVKALGG